MKIEKFKENHTILNIDNIKDGLEKEYDCKLIFFCKSGSHLYKLNTEKSDEDYVGVFIPSLKYYFGNKSIDFIDTFSLKSKDNNNKNTSNGIDVSLYSINKFVNILTKCNPNILELLFVNNCDILYNTEIFNKILDNRNLFLNRTNIYKAFYNYAKSQKKKLYTNKDNFNTKQSYHIVRLLDEAIELFETGMITFPLRYHNQIMNIKNNKTNIKDIEKIIDILFEKIKIAYDVSSLKNFTDYEKINCFLTDLVSSYFKYL